MILLCLILLTSICAGIPATSRSASDQILELHATEREGHLRGDASVVTSVLAESVASVQNGDVEIQSREQMRRSFSEYLSGVAYLSWDDLMKPSVHVSSDGTMAWAVVRIKARFREKGDQSGRIQEFKSSWIATYEKQNSQWRMTGISSGCNPPCGSPVESKLKGPSH